MKCPCCGSEIEGESEVAGSRKPLLQQLMEFERELRFQEWLHKELAKSPEAGHNNSELPPKGQLR